MPSGAPICLLRASARRIGANAYGGWPTPTASDAKLSRRHGYMIQGHDGTTLLDAIFVCLGIETRTPGSAQSSSVYPSPAFVAALMTIPSQWLRCAPSETP